MVAIAINVVDVDVVINEIHINFMIIVIVAVIELSFPLSQLMPLANTDVGRGDVGNNSGGDSEYKLLFCGLLCFCWRMFHNYHKIRLTISDTKATACSLAIEPGGVARVKAAAVVT
uniref:Uncharacterized protein n=1 Tax=Glossina pallidipes TaxID=7398 RepID=A0A1A9Z0K3_GLOPL